MTEVNVEYSPAYSKPGKAKKKTKIWNSPVRLHDIKKPEDKACRHCDILTGTESHRHPESRIIKFLDGGGIAGGKNNDNLTSWLCFECDAELSAPLNRPATNQQLDEHALKWALAIIKTHLI